MTECYVHGLGKQARKHLCHGLLCVPNRRQEKPYMISREQNQSATLKELSIPSLELMSARILAKLMQTMKNTLQPQLKIDGLRFWLDSKTALTWIQNKGEWKQFTPHRVNKILKLTNTKDWAYHSTQENPADLSPRGVFASQLKEDELWWHGP